VSNQKTTSSNIPFISFLLPQLHFFLVLFLKPQYKLLYVTKKWQNIIPRYKKKLTIDTFLQFTHYYIKVNYINELYNYSMDCGISVNENICSTICNGVDIISCILMTFVQFYLILG